MIDVATLSVRFLPLRLLPLLHGYIGLLATWHEGCGQLWQLEAGYQYLMGHGGCGALCLDLLQQFLFHPVPRAVNRAVNADACLIPDCTAFIPVWPSHRPLICALDCSKPFSTGSSSVTMRDPALVFFSNIGARSANMLIMLQI